MVTKASETDHVLDALGHPTRRQILALLREAPLAVGEIAERLPISRPAVSKHLRQLEAARLVEYSSIGTRNIFRLHSTGFAAARRYLDAFWEEALDRFQEVAELQERATDGSQ
jgi:DNA-binding transcriptional ArsR family regulator